MNGLVNLPHCEREIGLLSDDPDRLPAFDAVAPPDFGHAAGSLRNPVE